jgi:hypothetical protein
MEGQVWTGIEGGHEGSRHAKNSREVIARMKRMKGIKK